jgi:hypothetical protein
LQDWGAVGATQKSGFSLLGEKNSFCIPAPATMAIIFLAVVMLKVGPGNVVAPLYQIFQC